MTFLQAAFMVGTASVVFYGELKTSSAYGFPIFFLLRFVLSTNILYVFSKTVTIETLIQFEGKAQRSVQFEFGMSW